MRGRRIPRLDALSSTVVTVYLGSEPATPMGVNGGLARPDSRRAFDAFVPAKQRHVGSKS